jgi:hypothetical protein
MRLRGNTRRRGMTLIELMAVTSLMFGLIGMLYSTAHLAAAWQRLSGEVVEGATQGERVRGLVREAVRLGVPIPALSISADGRLVEGVDPDGIQSWGPGEALVLRGVDAYWVLGREGERLVRRRVGYDGRVAETVLARGVKEASFGLEDDQDGRPVGVAFLVSFREGSRSAEGFVGFRTEPVGTAPPDTPRPAPRWAQSGGGR